MSAVIRGPYLWRALQYRRHRASVGAFREHQLFPAVEFTPAIGATPWPEHSLALSAAWNDRLASTMTRQFLVLRDGVVTRRWTAPGTAPDEAGRLYSITKSVLSLAWGIADDQGLVPRLDSVVHEGLTVRQLLRMDSGLAFDEGFARLNHQTKTYLHPDSRRVARASRQVDPIGADFHYNDYHSLLLGTLLEEALLREKWRPRQKSGSLVASWIAENLLLPLGLQSPARWVVDAPRHGFAKTESGLCLSAADLARLGQLVLQGGIWEGQRLVSPDWLAVSTQRDQAWQGAAAFHRYSDMAWGPWLSQGRGYYGLHWWGRQESSAPDTIFAMGIHGQLLIISPRHRVVVVRLADRWALNDWWPDVIVNALDQGDL